MLKEPSWLSRARRQVGVREVAGKGSNPHIMAYRDHAKIRIGGDDGEVPWCAIFVNAMLELVGFEGTRKPNARSFCSDKRFREIESTAFGAIVVLSSNRGSWSGHVGFAVAISADRRRVKLLGGNQNDSVSEAWFDAGRVVGVYWPTSADAPAPQPCPIDGRQVASAAGDPRDA